MIIDSHFHLGKMIHGIGATEKDLLEVMKRNNIEKAVVLPIAPQRYCSNESQYRKQNLNHSDLESLISKHPKKFIPVYWSNPNLEINELDEMYKAIKIHPSVHHIMLDNKKCQKIIEFAEERDLPIFIHTGKSKETDPKSMEDTIKKFQNVNFVLYHAGMGNVGTGAQSIKLAKGCDNVYLETSHCLWMTVKLALEQVGAERIIYGSDFPIGNVAVEIKKIEELKTREKDKIFYKNILKLVG